MGRDRRTIPAVNSERLTAGIIGFGRIGQTTGRSAKALGMKVLACDIHFTEAGKDIATSDVVFLHYNLTSENEKFINEAAIARMKDGAILINNFHGQLADEQAVAEALKSGNIRGAALDVVSTEPIWADNPLLTAPNCIITPHMSWGAREARGRIMDISAENIRAYMAGKPVTVLNK